MRWAALLLLVCAACASDPETPATFEEACALVDGCTTPANALPGGRIAIWRVHVVREADGTYRIGDVAEAEVAAAVGVPQGPLGGEVALAALDGDGAPLELQLLHFPEVLALSPEDVFEDVVEQSLAGQAVDTIGYLQATSDVSRVAIVQRDGTVLAEVPAPEPGEATRDETRVVSGLIRPAPEGPCAHVVLINERRRAFGYYPRQFEESFPLLDAGPTQEAVVRAALGRMEPMHCAGVSRIAIARFDSTSTAGFVSARAGDMILINERVRIGDLTFGEVSLQAPGQRARFEHTLFHEAGHTMEWLLNAEVDSANWEGIWSPTQRSLAQETIDRVRLRGGFDRAWRRLHGSFRSEGWAGAYLLFGVEALQRMQIRGLDPEGIANYGVISQYATKSYQEDIAEAMAYPISAPLLRAAGLPDGPPPLVNDYACIAMREHMQTGVPQRFAAIFSKLSFLRDLGALSEEAVESCTGSALGLPTDVRGVSVYEGDMLRRRFTENLEASIGSRDDRYIFILSAEGTADFGPDTFDAELRLELDLGSTSEDGQERTAEQVSWPRGLYPLTSFSRHSFMLRLDGEAAGNFDVTDGLVLVTEATNDRILGSVVIRESFRRQAPFPVPEAHNPPLVFRFFLEN